MNNIKIILASLAVVIYFLCLLNLWLQRKTIKHLEIENQFLMSQLRAAFNGKESFTAKKENSDEYGPKTIEEYIDHYC